MSKEFTSAIEEKYTSRYDKRFKELQKDGDVFNPMLHRYDACIRWLVHKMIGAYKLGMRNTLLNRGSYIPNRVYGSPKSKLLSGINLINSSSKYSFRNNMCEVYSVDSWEDLLRYLVIQGIVREYDVDGRTFYNIDVSENAEIELKNKRIYSSEMEYRNSIVGKIDSIYDTVLEELAEVSYYNLLDWEPSKYDTRGNHYPREYTPLRTKAVLNLSKLRARHATFESIAELFQSNTVEEFISSISVLPIAGVESRIMENSELKDYADLLIYCLHIVKRQLFYHKNNYDRITAYGQSRNTQPFNPTIIFNEDSGYKSETVTEMCEREHNTYGQGSLDEGNVEHELRSKIDFLMNENEKLKSENSRLKSDNKDLRGIIMDIKKSLGY